MVTKGPAKKLTVYLDETDKFHGKPVYEVLLDIFFKKKVMGVSVFRGIAGYGSEGVFHTSKMLELSSSMPVKIEVVESEEMINRVLPDVYHVVEKGMVGLVAMNLGRVAGIFHGGFQRIHCCRVAPCIAGGKMRLERNPDIGRVGNVRRRDAVRPAGGRQWRPPLQQAAEIDFGRRLLLRAVERIAQRIGGLTGNPKKSAVCGHLHGIGAAERLGYLNLGSLFELHDLSRGDLHSLAIPTQLDSFHKTVSCK